MPKVDLPETNRCAPLLTKNHTYVLLLRCPQELLAGVDDFGWSCFADGARLCAQLATSGRHERDKEKETGYVYQDKIMG
jgi:hypothetical protein